MFRVLIMFGVGAAIVIAVALLIGSLAGVIVLAILVAIGLWRTWSLIQDWRRYGSGSGRVVAPGPTSEPPATSYRRPRCTPASARGGLEVGDQRLELVGRAASGRSSAASRSAGSRA